MYKPPLLLEFRLIDVVRSVKRAASARNSLNSSLLGQIRKYASYLRQHLVAKTQWIKLSRWMMLFIVNLTFWLLAGCSTLVDIPPANQDASPVITINGFPVAGSGDVEKPNVTSTSIVNVDLGMTLLISGSAKNPSGVKTFSLTITQKAQTLYNVTTTSSPDANNKVPDLLSIIGTNGAGGVGGNAMTLTMSDPAIVAATASNFNGMMTSVTVTYQPIATWALIGAIRWDAWIPGNDALKWVNPSIYTQYNHRRPFYGWYIADIDDQTEGTIMDQEIDYAADHNLDYWSFVWYPEQDQDPDHKKIMEPFNHYLLSSKQNRIKFAFILQSSWVAFDSWSLWESTFVPYFVQKFQDPQYVKVLGNRPLVFWFDSDQITPQRLQMLRDRTVAAGLGDPYIVDNNMNTDSAQSLGLQGVTSYGPSGARPDSDHQCWQAQVDKDTANWGPHEELASLPGLTPVNDGRPRSYDFWVDQPTYGQWEAHIKNAVDWVAQHPNNVSNPSAILIYAWNEIDEGGPGIVPTGQEGTKYLEAIKAVKTGNYPSSYVDVFNGTNCTISYSGEWTHYFPPDGVQGNYDNDEHISASAGAYAEITWSGVGFEVTGTKGPNRGEMEVFVDGTSQGIIDLWSRTWQQRVTLFSRLDLPTDSHTLRITVTGQKNPASIDYQVGIDTIRAKVVRSTMP